MVDAATRALDKKDRTSTLVYGISYIAMARDGTGEGEVRVGPPRRL
jgi:hypothetical protein